MKDLLKSCKRYLNDNLGIQAVLSKHNKKTGSLPFFLHDNYDFYKLNLLEKEFIVLAAKTGEDLTPAKIRKHIQIATDKLKLQAVFLAESLSSFNRQRLIAYKVPFIIPDNQMYLPDLGMDLKEHFIKVRSKTERLGPAAQVVVLYMLINHHLDSVTPKELADSLGYSMMSMSRAGDEIEVAGLAEVSFQGKRRVIKFDQNRRKLWEKALPFLKNPVKKRLWVNAFKDHALFVAGESALARYSMLAFPKRPVYAISARGWKKLQNEMSVEVFPYPDEAEFQLEVWRYDPQMITEGETVDPLSLYLSLKETEDERIESALEEMMEKIQW